jgi:hypothetical protein
MKRRHAWFGGAGASSLLLAGCLFHQNTVPKPPPVALDTSTAAVAPAADPEPLPPPPALPSDYHLRDATPTARVAGCASPREEKPRADARPAAPEPEAPKPAPDAPLVAALRCALEKHPAEARRLLAKYEKNDRELLLSLLRLTADLGEGDLEKLPPEQASRTLAQLSAVTTNLRLRAPLALEKVCFCKKIQGFGRYAPLPPQTDEQLASFQAGSEGRPGERVQIYAEVRNFACRRAQEGHYETLLESKLEIRDEERREVASIDLGKCVDRSQTPRQDYFLNFQLHVPAKLAPGRYTLWVKVRDVTTDPPREADSTLDFRVRAAGDEPRAEQ